MKLISARLGFWASLISLFCFSVYTFCFVAIMMINPAFSWTGYNEFVEYTIVYNQFFKYLAMCAMLIYGISYVIQIVCLADFADKAKYVFAKLAGFFAMGFAILIGINYFIQVSAVRLQLEVGQSQELLQFTMSYPISAVAAINMLGWTVFFGLSSIFAALSMRNSKLEKACKLSLFVNGLAMLMACIGYVANIEIVVFLCMFVLLGVTVFASTIFQCLLFKRNIMSKSDSQTLIGPYT